MNTSLIEAQLDYTIRTSNLDLPGECYRGKVRDTYRIGDKLVLVATDRISAFDYILRQTIPFKGQVLNQLAAFFFERTADVIPNHIINVPDPNVTLAVACTPFPVEFVVRGYLAGHAWREYKAGKRVLCGIPMPEGLRQNSPFPTPILTPATKAEEGHDEDISRDGLIARGLVEAHTFDYLAEKSLQLFRRGTELARERGLILVDTKYEFGRDNEGRLRLIDEVHTPDSSRYFYADTYENLLEKNEPQRQLSKEFVREWLMDHGFQGKEGQTLPDLPDAFRVEVASRYIELFERVSGRPFIPDTNQAPLARIEKALSQCLF